MGVQRKDLFLSLFKELYLLTLLFFNGAKVILENITIIVDYSYTAVLYFLLIEGHLFGNLTEYSTIYEGCFESSALYFTMLAYNVRGRCSWYGSRG